MRLPWSRPDDYDDPFLAARRQARLRGAGKLVAVVAGAGVLGTAVGVGLSKLNGNDSTAAPAVAKTAATAAGATTTQAATAPATAPAATQASTSAAASTRTITTTTAAQLHRPPEQTTGGKLRVDILSTIVHPVAADAARAGVTVHVRVTNGSSRVVHPDPPVLLVGDTVLALPPRSSSPDAPLVAALASGAIADGKLSFRTTGATTRQLTRGRVRVRVAGKTLTVTPQTGRAVSG
ncbi:MAG: hypothetical protein QOE11_853 [Solirubrobacteraceae bacterium]|nr:hypothetical protein [Solirubrobacteraceae bacterium]